MEQIEKLKLSRLNLINKNFKILFFVVEAELPSLAIYEIYNQVKILKEIGYDAQILTDKKDYKIPEFIDDDLKALPHVTTEENTFQITPEDFIIIPELFTNVMEQIKNLPCEKIVLLQNYENAMRSLTFGVKWADFNIRNVLTTSEELKKLASETLTNNQNFDIQVYNIGIPDYFAKTQRPKDCIVTYFSRNPQDISKVVKMFYLKYPHFSFISFEDLRGENGNPFITRKDFAKKIEKSFATLWLDRYTSYGTTPIEAMKVGTIPVGVIPEIIPNYIAERNEQNELVYKNTGFWSTELLTVPDMLADCVKRWLQDAVPDEMYSAMELEASKHLYKDSKQSIVDKYTYFIDKRINDFTHFIDNHLKPEQITEVETTTTEQESK